MTDETLDDLVNRLLSLLDLKEKNELFGEELFKDGQVLKQKIRIVLAEIKEKIQK